MTATSRPAAAKINGHVPLSLIHSSWKQDGDFLSIRPVKGAAVWRHAADAGHKTGPASVRIKEFHLFANVFKGIYLIFELLKLFENSPRVSKNRIDLHLIENVYSVAICLKGGDGSGRRGFVCRSVEANWKWMKREMKFQNGSSLNLRINGRPLRMLLLLLAEPQR